MSDESNLLKLRDVDTLKAVEHAFQVGPLAESLPSAPQLERRRLTAETFEREYRHRSRPVILEGYAADWPAVQTWTFDTLGERCATVPVVVDSYSSTAARKTTLGEFVQLLKASSGTGTPPIYLQEWLYRTSSPELAEDMPELDIAQYDFRRTLYGDAASENHQLWIGQQGGITRFHQDSYSVDVMHVQIVGQKRWYIMGPDARLELGDDGEPDVGTLLASSAAQLHQFVLQPGDVLYLPAWWYHRIELVTDSIGLGRKCLDEANLRVHVRQRLGELLALALNADELRRTHTELFDVVMTRARALAQLMEIDLSKLRQ